MSYQHFDNLDAFLAACAEQGVVGVGMRTVRETRPYKTGETGVTVGSTGWVELRAYNKPTILTLRLEGHEPGPLKAQLEGQGLTVRAKSGNIT